MLPTFSKLGAQKGGFLMMRLKFKIAYSNFQDVPTFRMFTLILLIMKDLKRSTRQRKASVYLEKVNIKVLLFVLERY